MNEDIIRMAREAGWTDDLMGVSFVQPLLARFAELVRADERKVCAEIAARILKMPQNDVSHHILARGNK